MEIIKAFEKLSRLNSDIDSMEKWLAFVEVKEKPVHGYSWIKLKKAIDSVIGDLIEEQRFLETKIKEVTNGLEI